MNYCSRCFHVFEQDQCPVCRNRKIRKVTEEDLCFLIEKQLIWTEIIKQTLEEHEIPYQCRGDKGAGLAIKMGPYLENYEFCVPYCYLEKARILMNKIFPDDIS